MLNMTWMRTLDSWCCILDIAQCGPVWPIFEEIQNKFKFKSRTACWLIMWRSSRTVAIVDCIFVLFCLPPISCLYVAALLCISSPFLSDFVTHSTYATAYTASIMTFVFLYILSDSSQPYLYMYSCVTPFAAFHSYIYFTAIIMAHTYALIVTPCTSI